MGAFKLSFDDMVDVFKSRPVWDGDGELYWYQYAWSALEKQGLTEFNSPLDALTIKLRALTLMQIYQEFSEALYQETAGEFYELVSSEFSDEEIEQVFSPYCDEGETYENACDLVEAVYPTLQYNLFNALNNVITGCDAFVWMYCTMTKLDRNKLFPKEEGTPTVSCCCGVAGGAGDSGVDSAEDYYEIISYDDFEAMVDEVYEIILDDCDCSEAFNYIISWMPR